MKKSCYLILLIFGFITVSFAQNKDEYRLFVGSYTDGKSAEGIYVYRFDQTSGNAQKLFSVKEVIDPSFMTFSPNGQFLYACTGEKGSQNGVVSAYKIDQQTGALSFINQQTTEGKGSCHVSIDKKGKYVTCSNYTESAVNLFECNKDGSLKPKVQSFPFEGSSVVKSRQKKSHMHSSVFSPDNKFLFSPDLGTDHIRVFTFDKKNLLSVSDELTIATEKGSGPRHFTFHPNKKYAYCVEELSGTVASYSYKKGQLERIDRDKSYQKTQETYGSADIHISPDGKFLYASNRWKNENTIAIFKINQEDGTLDIVGHHSTLGDHPRNFTIDPTGQFVIVANKNTHNIVVLRRDAATGLLSETGIVLEVQNPTFVEVRKTK